MFGIVAVPCNSDMCNIDFLEKDCAHLYIPTRQVAAWFRRPHSLVFQPRPVSPCTSSEEPAACFEAIASKRLKQMNRGAGSKRLN